MCSGPSTAAWDALGSEVLSLHDPWNRGAEEAEQKERLALECGVERGGGRKKERNSAGTDVLVFVLAPWLC